MEKSTVQSVRLRYDGRWKDFPGENRQWTIMNSFIDAAGHERKGGSFGLDTLKELGIAR